MTAETLRTKVESFFDYSEIKIKRTSKRKGRSEKGGVERRKKGEGIREKGDGRGEKGEGRRK